ncbi:MAG: thiol:disulfide interchange protein DsbA/DsbL [Pseudomonadota bacterium]
MKLFKCILLVLALLYLTSAGAQPEAGKDYMLLDQPQPARSGNKIEVIEFFFYGCEHCFKLRPLLNTWLHDHANEVEFVMVPTFFAARFEPMARTFYALQALGQQQELEEPLFNAWNVDKLKLQDEASATDFLAQHGVDRNKFAAAYNSPAVQDKVLQAKRMEKLYGVTNTPSLIVNGKYRVSANVKSFTWRKPEEIMHIFQAVVDKARGDLL